MSTAATSEEPQAGPLTSALGGEDARRQRRVAGGDAEISPAQLGPRGDHAHRVNAPGGAPSLQHYADEMARRVPNSHTQSRTGAGIVLRQILLPLLGLLVTGAAIQFGLLAAEIRRPGSINLPTELVGYPLAEARDGGSAAKAIGLTGTEGFPIISASAGTYGKPGQLTVWVGDNSTPLASLLMFRTMARTMEQGIPSRPEAFPTINEQGDTLVVHGTGTCGYLYRTGSRVVWLRADPPIAQRAILEIREFYP